VGGAKYVLLLVDWATHYIWMYALHSVTHKDFITLEEFVLDAGASPHQVYTDFDSKPLDDEMGKWFWQNKCKLHASPTGCQYQNGLVKHAWQMIV